MKCLFDNQMSPRLAKILAIMEGGGGVVVTHLREKFPPNTPDIEWIEKLGKERNWFVITRDNQIRKRPHEKKMWQESNLPIVFLEKPWLNYDLWEIVWRFVKYWPDLKDAISQSKYNDSFLLSGNGKISPYYGNDES
ncbi:MAG: hypothetical protein LBG93_07680 [Treponema sp.]|jgi:hypothetical protein|nr:hypothetical protein [Treponema sp.]